MMVAKIVSTKTNICPQGGVGQAKDDVPLTAFILISMNHALKVYELGSDTELVTLTLVTNYVPNKLTTE